MGALPWILLGLVAAWDPEQIHIAFGSGARSISFQWVTFQPTASSDVWVCLGPSCVLVTGSMLSWLWEQPEKYPTGIPRYMHTAEVSGLKPGELYSYRVGSEVDNVWSSNVTFKGPVNDLAGQEKTRNESSVIVLGDFGTCSDIPNATLWALIKEGQSYACDSFFHAGDIAYDLAFFNGVRGDAYMRSIEPFASRTPYMVAVGNHEVGWNYTHFKNRYVMPMAHDSLYYSVNIGPVHYIVYSSEVFYVETDMEMVKRNQLQWLISDLEQAKRDRHIRPWIVAVSHKPLYCTPDWRDTESIEDCYLQPMLVRRDYEDLFAAYGLDVHFHGHVHSYERTVPVYQGSMPPSAYDSVHLIVNPQAPLYVIDGIAGTCRVDDLDFISIAPERWSVFRSSELGYTRVYANETVLKITHITSARQEVEDYLYLVKTPKERN